MTRNTVPRNLVLCCDGTANQFAADRTSVIKLFHTLDKDPAQQVVYYHPGIGTRAPAGIVTGFGSKLARLAGQAVGYRLQDDIIDAYRFLMNTWQPGDRVYLIGFSRGAYTARAVASMLTLYGLAPAGNDALVPYAVEMMWGIARSPDQPRFEAGMRLADEFKATISGRACPVDFLGVWDTVNSVGWIGSPLRLPHTRTNPGVAIVRHAKALDERRGFFRVNGFAPDPARDVVEVWFPGNHGDVGGGWPEAASGMSKYPLRWMIDEAVKAGLLVDRERYDDVLGKPGSGYAEPSPDAPLHDALKGWWRLAEFVPKKRWNWDQHRWEWRMNRFRRRTVDKAPLVHEVAWEIPGYRVPDGARPYPGPARGDHG